MGSELRYAWRILRKNPGFASTAILALGLGIGANTAIFSLVDTILFHPPGIANPDRVVAVRVRYDKLNLPSIATSTMDFQDMRNRSDIFAAVATSTTGAFNYLNGGLPVRLIASRVTYRWFDVFGEHPLLGRTFTREEDTKGAEFVAVLSYATWDRYFGKDPGVVGRTLLFDGQPYKVIGVMPSGFAVPAQAEAWVPVAIPPAEFVPKNRHNQYLNTFARLHDGVTLEQAQTAAAVISQRVRQNADPTGFARSSGWSVFVLPYMEMVTGNLKAPMFILMGAVLLVLLIVCSNIAGLMLARASSRTREIALRAVLGASRATLIRQLFAESAILVIPGAVLGLAAALGGMRFLLWLAPERMVHGLTVTIDARVLLFTALVSLAAGLLFGLAPALQLSRTSGYDSLKDGGRSGTASKSRQRLRAALASAEIALALVLLVGAGLFLKSLDRLQSVSIGFQPEHVFTGMVALPDSRYKDSDRKAAFYRAVVDRLQNIPGVQQAAAITPLPFSGDNSSGSFQIEGRPAVPGDPGPHGDQRSITPGYFAAMSIPLRRGSGFTDADRAGAPNVTIIDETLAAQYWPNADPIGQRIINGPTFTIIGVAAHVRQSDLAADSGKGVYYFSAYQRPAEYAALVVKGTTTGAANAIREAVRGVDPDQAVYDLKSMDERIADSLGSRRFAVTLMGSFAAIALFLAAIGVFGVISYGVAQRTQEIGIRMALGAERAQVLGMVLKDGLLLAGTGIVAGAIAAAALARTVAAQLFGVSPFDPLTFIATAAVLLAVALLASYLPARRATRVDPMVALRYE